MKKRVWAAGLLIVCVVAVAAKEQLLECGSYFTKPQEEKFLHARHMVRRAVARSAETTAANRAALANQDIGEIAVIGAGNGVVGTRNPLDLASKTITFTPTGAEYSLSASTTSSYDAAASTSGTRLTLSDDDTESVTLPFEFHFFGGTYTSAFVNSNGTVTFGKGDVDFSGAYGHLVAGAPALAGLFTDLDPTPSSNGIRYLSEPSRAVFTWDAVPIAGSRLAASQTFQLRIYPSGKIEMAYATVGDGFDIGTAGIFPGNVQPVSLVDLTATTGTFSTGIAETFTSSTLPEIDMLAAAQRFYQTHDDAYDYLVFYNAMGVGAAPGVVAYELTARSQADGIGDAPIDDGASYGSPRELKAVLNLGPTTQYPADPYALVPARGTIGDTPVSILAHESGHLWLALTSVPSQVPNAFYPPMLGAALSHWAFPFNSDASFLEGNRIVDNGVGANPRFQTVATVQHYSALDQYLMGFRDSQDVAPTFAVLDSGVANPRPPQTGVSFNGTRLDIPIGDVIKASGRRRPDATVAQRAFRLAFIMIVAEDADLSAGSSTRNAIAQVDVYRQEFEKTYGTMTDGRAKIITSLRRSISLSLSPNAGVAQGQDGQATMTLSAPATSAVKFTIDTPQGILSAPASVTIAAGAKQASFTVRGVKTGVEELRATPDNSSFETGMARVQVRPQADLKVAVVSGDKQPINLTTAMALPDPVVVRAVDENLLPYSNQSIEVTVAGGGSVDRSVAITDARGEARFAWTPALGSFNTLTFKIAGAANSAAVATAVGKPAILTGGVVNGASFVAPVTPGGFATLFGGSLAGGAQISEPGQASFPIDAEGVSVLFNGAPGGLVYVSDSQLNVVVPATILSGTASVVVRSSIGESVAMQVPVVAHGPGVFFDASSGAGAVLIAGTGIRTEERPAKTGEFLEIYATGLGATPDASVKIGGLAAQVTYAGPTTVQGLQQVNVLVPSGIPSGSQDLVLTVNGAQANPVRIRIQ